MNTSAPEVERDFKEFVSQADFPCLGAKATVRQNACTIRKFESLGNGSDIGELARELGLFGRVLEKEEPRFNSFAAVFPSCLPSTEREFDERLWRHLDLLHGADPDSSRWAPTASDNPEDPDFSFSFGGVAYFIVGLSPVSSRLARQFKWPTLVFNPHAVFDRLRSTGTFDRMKTAIRQRDELFQGSTNPNLADFGDTSEARQYSGLEHPAEWKCPFNRGER